MRFSFRRRKLHVRAIEYSPGGWIMEQSDFSEQRWQCPDFRGIYQTNYLAQVPDLPPKGWQQPRLLQNFFRQSAVKFNGGLILAECIELQGLRGIKNIIKAPQAQGMRYLAAYIFPFKSCSFGMKFITEEFEMQGLRESMVAAEFFDGQQMPASFKAQCEAHWFADPYQQDVQEGTPMCKAELPEYDARFPDHPLSRLRLWMEELEHQISFGKVLYQLKGFY